MNRLQEPGVCRKKKRQTEKGFTLLEVIITMLFAAILGSALVQILGANLSDSSQAVAGVHAEAQLKSSMEQITSDYREWLRNNPGAPLASFRPIAAAYANVTTAFVEVDAGNDGDIQILLVTATHGDRTLKALFTQ